MRDGRDTATLGVATIGQAPREDIRALFAAEAPAGTRVVLRGCLDGLSHQELAARGPIDGDDTLYTRLKGERDIKISKQVVAAGAAETIAALRRDGATAIVFACTGEFPPFAGDAGVVFPSRVLSALAGALLPAGRLGILIPLPEQARKLTAKWSRPGLEVFAEPLIPSAPERDIAAAAERLAAHRPDLVAMDCMSYAPATKAIVRQVCRVPTLLAITAAGRVLREMLE
jgi:protein AroM